MQKWEYMLITLVRSYGMNYRANGTKMNDWKDLPLHEVFNKVGRAGFEFVAFDGDSYMFKRPVQSGNGGD